jgi:hypothetical protein
MTTLYDSQRHQWDTVALPSLGDKVADPQRTNAALLRPKPAADLIAVSVRALWGLTYPRGPIAAVRIGRSVRYDPADLQAFILSAKKGGAK